MAVFLGRHYPTLLPSISEIVGFLSHAKNSTHITNAGCHASHHASVTFDGEPDFLPVIPFGDWGAALPSGPLILR